eukprot:1284425-Ditylum_brightwellii.AAC.1
MDKKYVNGNYDFALLFITECEVGGSMPWKWGRIQSWQLWQSELVMRLKRKCMFKGLYGKRWKNEGCTIVRSRSRRNRKNLLPKKM